MPTFTEDLLNAVEAAGIGFAEVNANECFERMNPAYAAMLGRAVEELIGQSWRCSVHPEDHGRTGEAYRQARSGVRNSVEIRGLRADGSILYQVLTVTKRAGENGELTGFHCLRHDISGYKSDQEALALAVESAPNGLFMLGASGRIMFVNGAVERLFGYSRPELIDQPVETLLPERFRVRHRGYREDFNRDQSIRAMAGRDLTGRRKDGVEIPLQVYLNTIDAPAGTLILCTIIDIAERVRYQEQLELAKQAAEAANRAKSDFLARMSHEIRTPMNLIIGMNALLLESQLSEKQRQYVEISYRNVKRLLRLINGILDLSKVEAGKLTLAAVPFDLHEALAEALATISAAVERKGLVCNSTVDPAVWPYWVGDQERLQQVLLNLLGNAVKFTVKGQIELRVGPVLRPDGVEGLQFEISDTGCGVPPEQADTIFDAFQQVDGTMNRTYEGTGLGLAIAKTLVQMMGGSIWAARKEGPGATFSFTVFFQRSAAEDLPRGRAFAAPGLPRSAAQVRNGTRILVAEDNPENAFLLQAYLGGLPVVLDFAANGLQAVEKRCAGDYDLVLMDIQMPVMDGYTATRKIRAWERANGRSPVSVVALTAHALSHAASESLDAGCDGHVSKPVERDDLVAAIAKFATHQPAERRGNLDQQIESLRPEFLGKRRDDLARIQEALAAGDFGTVQRIGHNCKGIAKGYGFPEIGLAGAALESAARAADVAALESAVRQFSAVVAAASVSG